MPRFVILFHELPVDSGRDSHWDLMLERDEKLATWAFGELRMTSSFECEAIQLDDHRLHYLDYEGPVSNNRGEVRRVAAGRYEIVQWSESAVKVALTCKDRRMLVELQVRDNPRWCIKFHPTSGPTDAIES